MGYHRKEEKVVRGGSLSQAGDRLNPCYLGGGCFAGSSFPPCATQSLWHQLASWDKRPLAIQEKLGSADGSA